MKQIAWLVFFRGRHISTVFFTEDCTSEYIVDSLVNHDSFPLGIYIRQRGY